MAFLSLKHTKSQTDLVAASNAAKLDCPTSADAYEMLDECGRGVSANVWRAVCTPLNEEVAVKLLDLENMSCSLEEIIREAQTMKQLSHPNVLPLYCSFVAKSNLWMVMPYVSGGSVLNIMKYAFPEGLEEPVIATILKEVLKGLEYLHKQGCIHRDVKAGNILIDKGGQVYLADFGVAASMERGGSWGHQQAARNTFVGTPCWMAPEVMEQMSGYGPLADIWSFGITILELAHGHAPFAKLPPMKVLLMTIQNPPPTLDTDSSKKHFSKAMRDIVAKCLVKDPTKRPTASQLLEHKFFKTAHDSSYLVKHLLAVLPPLPERVRQMRLGSTAELRAQAADMAKSQEAYVRGVSSWNFDVAALREQAMEDKGPSLPTVVEGSERSMRLGTRGSGTDLQDTLGGANGSSVPAPINTTSIADSGPPMPLSAQYARSTVAASPVHVRSASVSADGKSTPVRAGDKAALTGSLSGSKPASSKAVHKKQGRFDVWEGDADDMPSQPSLGDAALSKASMASDADGKGDGEGIEKAKRKGRFHIVEEESYNGADKRASMARTGSSTGASHDGGSAKNLAAQQTPSPTQQSVGMLLGPLKELQDQLQGPYELLRELVVAVGDSDKGKHSHLSSLIQERLALRATKEDGDRLRSEVAVLREENGKLREKLRMMESKLQRIQLESQTPMPSPDKRQDGEGGKAGQ